MQVRQARVEDSEIVRGVRLRALLDALDAFSSSYEREARFPGSVWVDRLATSANVTLACEDDDADAQGMITVVRDPSDVRVGWIVGMWRPVRRSSECTIRSPRSRWSAASCRSVFRMSAPRRRVATGPCEEADRRAQRTPAQRTGISASPSIRFEFTRGSDAGSAASSSPSKRVRMASNMSLLSSRARWAPRQK